MQYLLHDLIKLPLNERLTIIEKMLSSITFTENETDIQNFHSVSGWHKAIMEKLNDKNN